LFPGQDRLIHAVACDAEVEDLPIHEDLSSEHAVESVSIRDGGTHDQAVAHERDPSDARLTRLAEFAARAHAGRVRVGPGTRIGSGNPAECWIVDVSAPKIRASRFEVRLGPAPLVAKRGIKVRGGLHPNGVEESNGSLEGDAG